MAGAHIRVALALHPASRAEKRRVHLDHDRIDVGLSRLLSCSAFSLNGRAPGSPSATTPARRYDSSLTTTRAPASWA